MDKYKLKKSLLVWLSAFILSNPKIVYANENIMDVYLEEELKFYKENPNAIERDVKKNEIVIDYRGKKGKKLISHSIENIKNEFGDIAYIHATSIGNETSKGDGVFTKNFDYYGYGKGYIPVVVVGVKTGEKYPLAVAEYNVATNTIGDIIGWFKDKDVYARIDNYAETIEMPISKYITYGNIYDFDIDENGNLINNVYMLPYGYIAIDDNYRHGIRIGYTSAEKDGYYTYYNEGLYVSKNVESVRSKVDDKNLELILKFNIKNK